jgi:hypothetical protein
MDTEPETCRRYEAELAAIAALDRAYYLTAKATPTDRASYFRRQVDLEQVRTRLYAELSQSSENGSCHQDELGCRES